MNLDQPTFVRSAEALRPSTIGIEALDDPATEPALVDRMLREIAQANRWFGGRAAVRTGLRALLLPGDRELTLFDVGTGAGDLPRWATRWTARRGIRLRTLGLERLPAAAQLARRSGLPIVRGCASALPLRDRSVDIVLLSQLVHHFDDAGVLRLFREASRIARRGVIIAELRPSRSAALAYRVAGRLLGFHPTTIGDGVTSSGARTRPAATGAARSGSGTSPASAGAALRTNFRRLAHCAMMQTVDQLVIRAHPDRVWSLAREVEAWPAILPHYRWVTRLEGDRAGDGTVEMAAWRPFGLARWPTWWRSRMAVDAERREIRYWHIAGITTGMEVLWTIHLTAHGESDVTIVHRWRGPAWPLIRRPAAEWIIGPVFVHGIASRTLAGIARQAEAR